MVAPEILQRLQQELEPLYKRLFYYTRRELRIRGWQGYDANDFVTDAIDRVLTGRRNWNPEAHPDLVKYMFDVIDSILGHFPAELRRIRREQRGQAATHTLTDDQEAALEHDKTLRRELEEQSGERLIGFLDSLGDDLPAKQMAEMFWDGNPKREAIAADLGITAQEHDAVRKRLKRRVERYFDVSRIATKRR